MTSDDGTARARWTVAQLAEHLGERGVVSRPTIAFRFRAETLPRLPPKTYAYRWYLLQEQGWSEPLVRAFEALDAAWKYADLYTPQGDHPEHLLVVLRGYNNPEWVVSRALQPVVDLIDLLQARGVRVEVADEG